MPEVANLVFLNLVSSDINAQRPEGVFSAEQVDDLVAILDLIQANSAA